MVVNGDRYYRCRYEATLKMCVASVASGITPEVWIVPWGWLANIYIQFVLNLGQWSMSGLITINQYKSGECHHCPAIIYNVLFSLYPSSSMVWFPWFPLGHWARIFQRPMVPRVHVSLSTIYGCHVSNKHVPIDRRHLSLGMFQLL